MRTSLRNFTMLVSIKRILILSGIVSQFVRCVPVFAQTIIPGGNVAGSWTAAGSPYLVQGDITVASSDALSIGPGVDVLFQGFYRLTVSGILEAIGTESDSISFMPSDTVTGWRGLYIDRAGSTQHISYCDIEYAYQSGIQVQAVLADVQVSHCTIAHCRNDIGGGILVSNRGKLKISHSTVAYNTAECDTGGYGGGIHLLRNTLRMDSCVVHGNRAVSPNNNSGHTVCGGGIYIGSWAIDVVISGSTITDNFVGMSDGSIHEVGLEEGGGGLGSGATDNTVDVSDCVIRGNRAAVSVIYGGGGGIFTARGARYTRIVGCEISENSTPYYGSAIFAIGSALVSQSTVHGNYGDFNPWTLAFGRWGAGNFNISNTIVALNSRGIFAYEAPSVTYSCFLSGENDGMQTGFGALDTVNANGDSCDMHFNIFMDPMFVDTANGNLHLLAGSPCIDAGDPTSPLDPDGSVADMGAYYGEYPLPIQLASFAATVIGQSRIRLEWVTLTEINNYGFEIHRKRGTTGDWKKIGFVPGHGTTLDQQSYTYLDQSVTFGNYFYRITQIDLDGRSKPFPAMEVIAGVNPGQFLLAQNYPNPFNPTSTIEYVIPQQSHVTLRVYDILGRVVQTLVDEMQQPGLHEVQFDAAAHASGFYLYRMEAGSFTETKKLLVLK